MQQSRSETLHRIIIYKQKEISASFARTHLCCTRGDWNCAARHDPKTLGHDPSTWAWKKRAAVAAHAHWLSLERCTVWVPVLVDSCHTSCACAALQMRTPWQRKNADSFPSASLLLFCGNTGRLLAQDSRKKFSRVPYCDLKVKHFWDGGSSSSCPFLHHQKWWPHPGSGSLSQNKKKAAQCAEVTSRWKIDNTLLVISIICCCAVFL